MAKRQRYLSELLSSERVYASDLALIREIHVPMALDQRVSLNVTSPSPSTSRISISSHSSSSSLNSPMTPEDARMIFRNIAELAVFADSFCDCLEEALGSTFEGGQGEGHVGNLFLEKIPEMERVFTHYIIRHSVALAHLQALPQRPALATYLQHVQAMGSIYSHARDLPSFLTKPVHRLLMYSSLLASITDETPDMHSDKESLKLARAKMEEVVRNLNERRRGWEGVKEALSAKEVVKVGFTPSVSLTTMKLLWRRSDARSAQLGIMDANGEAAQVERMRAELKRVDIFTQQFSEGVIRWVKMTSNVVLALKAWSVNFGKVLGLSEEQGSETFSAFLAVIEALVPLCHQLTIDVNDQLIEEIASLRASMNQPLKVLSFMTEQAPFHHKFATDTSMKHPRFPAPLTSVSYVALRRQLAAELPTYLTLLHRGLTVTVRRLAKIQATFWGSMHVSLAELWDMVRMEGEINKGHSETVAVWERRWSEVNEVMCNLSITQTDSVYQERASLDRHDKWQSVRQSCSKFDHTAIASGTTAAPGI